MSDECKPTTWFLKKDEKVEITLRETGEKRPIPQDQLLGARLAEWGRANNLSSETKSNWGMIADAELTARFTSGNEVRALIDGKDYMGDLRDNITGDAGKKINPLGEGDFILIAGWEFWRHRSLLGRVKKPLNQQDSGFLRNVLKGAVEKGAAVRVLAFKQALPGLKERTEHFINAVRNLAPKPSGGAQPLSYACHTAPRNFAMSHHQKEVVICRSKFEDSRAYVGGMDLAIDRWDDSHHNAEEKEGRNFGWHDLQVVVQGDALLQLWANFAERWEAEAEKEILCPVPLWAVPDKPPDKPKEDDPLKLVGLAEWKKRPKMGTKHVQVLRTIGAAGGANPKRFMPQGERTVMCALKKAIEQAECYIYIEEQFLWDCELADFIAEQKKKKKKENKDLHLIIVMTAGCELPARLKHYALHLRSEFFRNVLGVERTSEIKFGPDTKVYPYGLFQVKHQVREAGRTHEARKEIYVHSKLFIIDDRYVAVGSANVDARSLHIETELTLGIVDEVKVAGSKLAGQDATVCKFAKELREALWKEHLGVETGHTPLPPDPIEALTNRFPGGVKWPTNEKEAKENQKHHLRCYTNPPRTQRTERITGPMKRLIDRNDRKWW